MTTLSEHLSRLGQKGGKARAKNMSVEERIESARKAVEARWAKQRAESKELNEGAKAPLDKGRKRETAAARKTRTKS
jgi:hypothetical protein